MSTFGQYLVNNALPAEYRSQEVLTKGRLHQVLADIARNKPHLYPDVVTKLKRLGDEIATLDGISVGLDDIAPNREERDAALKPHIAAYNQAKTEDAQQKALVAAQHAMLEVAKNNKGTMGEMVRSGGRGNAAQLMRTVGAPVMVNDSKGPVNWLIPRSFSEGLKPSDAWVAGGEARIGAMLSTVSIVEPGDLAKILVNNMGDKLIVKTDCGTKNGISMAGSDPHIVDRYLAGTNTLITPKLASEYATQGKTVLVRSPMTCEAHGGICQLCQGLSPSGQIHPIGVNVGMRAAQALSEPLTQIALNAKHGGRVAGGVRELKLEGMKGVRSLLEIPSSFMHKAVLAEKDGVVDTVVTAPQGGHYITVSGVRHYADPELTITVKQGESVYAGDALTNGVPKPDEVVRFKGLGEGRKYLVDAMADIYKRAGTEVDKRHLETMARSVLNHVKITDPGPEDGFVRGDVVNYNRFSAAVAATAKKLPVDQAVGETLAQPALHYTIGTVVTPSVAQTLSSSGFAAVAVAGKAPQAMPYMRSASRTPLLNPDWMSRLAHRYLKESLLTGIHRGDVTDLHGSSPVPAYVAGTEFGIGPGGQY